MTILDRGAHESAKDYALRTIKYNITTMHMEPGSKINDQEIAAALGISRTPVREALMELAKYDLVVMYPQKGSVVAPVRMKLIQEAAVTRNALECAAVRRCCHLSDPTVFCGLQDNIDLMRFYINRQNISAMTEMDIEFHKILFTHAGMTLAHGFLRNLEIHYRRIISLCFLEGTEDRTVLDHQAILNAIMEQNETKAVAAMQKHLRLDEITEEEVLNLYPDCIIDESNIP